VASKLLWLIFALSLAAPLNRLNADDAVELDGVVDSIGTDGATGKSVLIIRTATQNITVDTSQLSSKAHRALFDPAAKQSITHFSIDSKAIVNRADVPGGVRPDCSELPLSIDDLQNIVKSGSVNSMQDFLDAIPKGTLQSFTLVTNSLSLQRGGENGGAIVSPLWPRVLRFSADSKMAISFVCDPKNPHYGSIETMYFDDKANAVKTVEWQFTKDGAPVPPEQRIHQNPEACLRCHDGGIVQGKQVLKYNWPQYFTWSDCQRDRGISTYGGSDDFMGAGMRSPIFELPEQEPQGCDDTKYRKAHEQEIADYQTFKTAQAGNACFGSLPWLAKNPGGTKDAKTYPYLDVQAASANGSDRGYSNRPNLRLTDGLTRWTARRNAQFLKSAGPYYDFLKYYLVMESAKCLTPEDADKIKEVTGLSVEGTDTPGIQNSGFDFQFNQPLLYQLSKKIGLQPKDWSLTFNENTSTVYNAGDNELLSRSTATDVLLDIAKTDSSVRPIVPDESQSYIVRSYGKNFSCVDQNEGNIGGDLANKLDRSTATNNAYQSSEGYGEGDNTKFCQALHQANQKHLAKATAAVRALSQAEVTCLFPGDNPNVNTLADQVKLSAIKLDQAAVDRGRALVQPDSKGKCVICHSSGANSALPPDYRFIPDEKASPGDVQKSLAVLKARMQEGFLDKVEDRLIQNKTMPPIQNDLNAQDRDDIKAYIESLMKQ
jgi:mono/diheme cytochrome c family protein